MLPKPITRNCDLLLWNLLLGLLFVTFASAEAVELGRQWQPVPARPFVVHGADRRLLDRAERFLADEQWGDAVAALMRLIEPARFHLVAIDEQRYVGLSDYCHRLLAELPAEPLDRYRQLVDATAESWYRQGIAEHDTELLQRVVNKYFCSSWGDDALFSLGELALQRGDTQAARNAWSFIGPQHNENVSRLAYPGTDLSLAVVQARLVLVSIREGDWERAERELADLRTSNLNATGRLGGREVVLVEHLSSLLKQARQWPVLEGSNGWRTYAANSQRTSSHVDLNPKGPYELVWSRPIANPLLSIFPVVVNGLVIYQDSNSVRALRLTDGEPVFHSQGEVFNFPSLPSGCLGQLRHTLTATDRYLFGVTAAPIGPRHKSDSADKASVLWSLDLERDGAISLHRPNEDSGVAFAGAPMVEGSRVFVPIHSSKQTARMGVACYDRGTGKLCWQRWLCRANTPATGRTSEIVGNLLAYDSGILYVNTNLGAIAAVRADDGQVLWLRAYERQVAEQGRAGQGEYYRGPSPCVFYRGMVLAKPTDCEALLAIDATTGEQIWRRSELGKVADIFGVQGNRVILSSGGLASVGLQTFDLRTGGKLGEMHNSTVIQQHAEQANSLVTGEYAVVAGREQLSVFRFQEQTIKDPQDLQTSTKE